MSLAKLRRIRKELNKAWAIGSINTDQLLRLWLEVCAVAMAGGTK